MGFTSFMVTDAEFHLGRCSLRNVSIFIAVTYVQPWGSQGLVGQPTGQPMVLRLEPCSLALGLCSNNWPGACRLDSFSIAAFLTAPQMLLVGNTIPCKDKHHSPKHCRNKTSHCSIWDYCCKVLKDPLSKRKQAKNPKEPFSPKASTIPRTSWYYAFHHKNITM